jgi:drug/metabolite transporter (DMT)-like permease
VEVVILALVASGFTAMASVAQRRAAAPAPGELSFSWRLVGFLIHRPLWFLGILCMILGFVFQVAALRMGSLSLVQPLIAVELVLVFAMIAFSHPQRVHARDWLAAVGMAVGLGAFLALARPRGGQLHASLPSWGMAGLSCLGAAGLLTVVAYLPGRGGARKAALLGVAAAVMFGFVAAVVKELSTHLSQGLPGVFENWSPYVLILSGAVAMYLASNAFQAGSLAASQPGLTIVDPLVASALGVALFGERIDVHPWAVVGEVVAFALIVTSVVALARSPLVREERVEKVPEPSALVEVPTPALAGRPAGDLRAGPRLSDRSVRVRPPTRRRRAACDREARRSGEPSTRPVGAISSRVRSG